MNKLLPNEVDDLWFCYREENNGKEPQYWHQVTTFDRKLKLGIVSVNKRCGAVNRNGEIIIPLMYDFIDFPMGGLIKVKLNEKFGFVNSQNKIIIDFKYTETTLFKYNYVGVSINGKWGIIDNKENTILDFKYDYCESVGRNLFCVGLLTEEIHKNHQKYTFPWTEFGEKLLAYGVINKVGDIIVPFNYYSKIKIINKREALIYNYEEQKFYIYDILDKLTKEYEEKLV